jgi:hypothetical protein
VARVVAAFRCIFRHRLIEREPQVSLLAPVVRERLLQRGVAFDGREYPDVMRERREVDARSLLFRRSSFCHGLPKTRCWLTWPAGWPVKPARTGL